MGFLLSEAGMRKDWMMFTGEGKAICCVSADRKFAMMKRESETVRRGVDPLEEEKSAAFRCWTWPSLSVSRVFEMERSSKERS